MIVTLMLICLTSAANDLRIVSTNNGKTLSVKQLAKDLKGYDLIFFGEFHDNADLHKLQSELLPLIMSKRELILSFEMFERDVQSEVDAYIEGWTTEERFMLETRVWQNYESDYKPLIEYAKKFKLGVLAANVPRRFAGQLTRQGMAFIDELEPDERRLLAENITSPEDEYQKAFYDMMNLASSASHGMMTDTEHLERLYQAQCLKDDTMAESIIRAFAAKPKAQVIHFNGEFHSRNFLGTVSRVKSAMPKLKIAVISPTYDSNWQNANLSPADKKAGTHLILLPEPSSGGEE